MNLRVMHLPNVGRVSDLLADGLLDKWLWKLTKERNSSRKTMNVDALVSHGKRDVEKH